MYYMAQLWEEWIFIVGINGLMVGREFGRRVLSVAKIAVYPNVPS